MSDETNHRELAYVHREPPAASTRARLQPSQTAGVASLTERAPRFQVYGEERLTADEVRYLPLAIKIAREDMEPAGARALLIQLERMSTWAAGLNIPHDPATMAETYKALASLPADLLTSAFTQVMNTTRDTFRLPMPGHLYDAVKHELGERRKLLAAFERMDYARQRGRVEARRINRKDPDRLNSPEYQAFQASWARQKEEMEAREREVKRQRANTTNVTLYQSGTRLSNPELDACVRRAYAKSFAQQPPPPPKEGGTAAVEAKVYEQAASVSLGWSPETDQI